MSAGEGVDEGETREGKICEWVLRQIINIQAAEGESSANGGGQGLPV